MQPVSISDYRERARRTLPSPIFDYLEGGAESEGTLRRNREAFSEYGLTAHLRDAAGRVDLSCSLLGSALSMPIVLAPTGALRLIWPDGDAAIARAANACGVLMVASAGSSTSLEEVTAGVSGPRWLQISVYRDWQFTRSLLAKAKALGFAGLCVTLDAGAVGKRERDIRNRLDFSRGFCWRHWRQLLLHWRWTVRTLHEFPITFPNFPYSPEKKETLAEYFSRLGEPCPNWQAISRVRLAWDGLLVLKGIVSAADAKRAVNEGADAVIVSNHGGRQFDSGVSTLHALPHVVDAVEGNVPVLLDGGISRGTDVLKALALGASACMVGRAHLWGLAARGEEGALAALAILRAEIHSAMQFCGVDRPCDLDARHVARLHN